MISLIASSALVSPTETLPERYQHHSYQRLEREVSIRASARFLLVRRSPSYQLSAVEKLWLKTGASQGLHAHLWMRDQLAEIDLGERANFARLLAFAETLQERGLIEVHFPVWTRPPDGRSHVDDRVVLKLKSVADEEKLMARFGLTVVQRYPQIKDVISVNLPKSWGHDAIAAARHLHNSGAFAWAEPDWIFHPKALWDPNDPRFEASWHQIGGNVTGSINGPEAWEVARGAGVTVGVIDSGTQQDHPDLDVFAGYDLVDDDSDASPECIERHDGRGRADSCPSELPYRESHGTAVSGLVAARSNDIGGLGVCPECRLVTVRMVGVSQRRVTHADGLRWLIAQNTAVVNNSWGPSISRFFPMGVAEEEAIGDAMTTARQSKGMLLLYAAGNDNLLDASSNPYSTHPETVTVSGSSKKDDFACYSNYGETIDVSAPTKGCYDGEPGLRTIDITGGEGYNEGDYHDGMGGTSGACPVASGVAALIVSTAPDLTARQVRLILQASSQQILADKNDWPRRVGADLETIFGYDESGHSLGFGYGRVDAAAAVRMAQNFTLLGPCEPGCTSCRQDRCATACDGDTDCPGQSVCVADDQGVKACEWPTPDPSRIGAACSDACEHCIRVASQGQSRRNLCTVSCADNDACPGGWICAPTGDLGKVCVPGFPGCGSNWGDERCTGDVRVLDSRERAFCSCPCFPSESAEGGGYCPEGFHCGRAECRCTRQGRGGCRETTCEETTGQGNYNPVCFPDAVEDPPCDEDSDCGMSRICVENECRDDPYFCSACASCERHSDCGQGNWCAPVDGRDVCLVACGSDGRCPGDSVCRAISSNGRTRRFCLNDPARTSDRICPPDYSCRHPEGRCRVAADCPTRDHWCDDDGECRLDDDVEPEPVTPPPPMPTTTPVSGCACAQNHGFDGLMWLSLIALVGRRRLGGLRQAG